MKWADTVMNSTHQTESGWQVTVIEFIKQKLEQTQRNCRHPNLEAASKSSNVFLVQCCLQANVLWAPHVTADAGVNFLSEKLPGTENSLSIKAFFIGYPSVSKSLPGIQLVS